MYAHTIHQNNPKLLLTITSGGRILNVSMSHDWTHLFKMYKGLWVALLDDEKTVVGSGKTAATAMKQANVGGHKTPILTRVPDTLSAYIG
ncbi:MAG: hypothetical protein RLZZ360_893 [Candidatus Parcubacteria bacterium]|jgi:hypothetical protein